MAANALIPIVVVGVGSLLSAVGWNRLRARIAGKFAALRRLSLHLRERRRLLLAGRFPICTSLAGRD
jgi:hypothetical protein